MPTEPDPRTVKDVGAPDDGRIVAIHIRSDFDEVAWFPPSTSGTGGRRAPWSA